MDAEARKQIEQKMAKLGDALAGLRRKGLEDPLVVEVEVYDPDSDRWERGPDLPQGFQDSDGGFIGTQLITVGGFCGGGDDARKPGHYPRGFLKFMCRHGIWKSDPVALAIR